MNVLILGGNGYIGSKVTRKLINEGHNVVCTKRKKSSLVRLDNIINEIKWIPASIDAVESAVQYMEFDYVINFICNYGRKNVLYDDVIEANIEFPLKVLNTVVEKGTNKYLTIGTGLPDRLNMYSFSKRMFSEFGRFYAEKHNIVFNSLQLEMFYGADEPKNRFLTSIVDNMIKGNMVEITLGTQKRDIIAVEDVVKAIMMVIHSKIEGFNEIPVGTGEAPSISEIVDYVWEQTGKKSKVIKGAIPMRIDEPDCVADNSILKSIGEWEPTKWRNGLRDMIESMRRNI